MKMFRLKLPHRACGVEFTEQEIKETDDFADPEREDILALGVGKSIKLADGAVVTRDS